MSRSSFTSGCRAGADLSISRTLQGPNGFRNIETGYPVRQPIVGLKFVGNMDLEIVPITKYNLIRNRRIERDEATDGGISDAAGGGIAGDRGKRSNGAVPRGLPPLEFSS